jgi:voltage-gated potassium channel
VSRNPVVRKLFTSLSLLALVYGAGVTGYMVLERWDFQDASFMTVITLATVGYGETRPLSPAGRWFTMALILGGMCTLLYALSSITAFVVEGELRDLLRRTRMEKEIAKLSNHFIICGAGRVGLVILKELLRTGNRAVLVDQDVAEVHEWGERHGGVLALQGDPTDDETLQLAGVERARGLLAALDSDKDNLFVVLSARGMNKDLRIVARADEEATRDKLLRAGADTAVLTQNIGGMRMASEMIRPTVVNFLDTMLREKESTLRVEEAVITQGSDLDGQKLQDADIRRRTGALLVAVRRPDGGYEFNPPSEREFRTGEVLVVIGDPGQLKALRKIAGLE